MINICSDIGTKSWSGSSDLTNVYQGFRTFKSDIRTGHSLASLTSRISWLEHCQMDFYLNIQTIFEQLIYKCTYIPIQHGMKCSKHSHTILFAIFQSLHTAALMWKCGTLHLGKPLMFSMIFISNTKQLVSPDG